MTKENEKKVISPENQRKIDLIKLISTIAVRTISANINDQNVEKSKKDIVDVIDFEKEMIEKFS